MSEYIGDISINISSSTVAWYGAIVASLTAIKAMRDWWNDRSRVHIEWQFNMNMTGKSEKYMVITVINKGNRPVKITHVATKLYGEKEIRLLGHSFTNEDLRVLTEERPSTSYPVIQHGMNHKNLWYVSVYDARGKEYRRYNPESTPLTKRALYQIHKPKNNAQIDLK